MSRIWFEYGSSVVLVLCLAALVLCGREMWYGLRRWHRRRAGESGRVFPVISRPVLPYEDDGPGTYLITGVLERRGTPTCFKVEASGVPDAMRKAAERGVFPSAVTKQQQAT